MQELETERLNFRLVQESDIDVFAEHFSNEEQTKYIGGIKNRDEAWRLIATYLGHYYLKGFSYMAVEEKSSNNFIGCVGLWKSEQWPELELGYWLVAKTQGKGYASEAALAVKNYAFDTLKSKSLVSYIHVANEPSKKVAQRLGAVQESEIELLDFGPHLVYRYNNDYKGA